MQYRHAPLSVTFRKCTSNFIVENLTIFSSFARKKKVYCKINLVQFNNRKLIMQWHSFLSVPTFWGEPLYIRIIIIIVKLPTKYVQKRTRETVHLYSLSTSFKCLCLCTSPVCVFMCSSKYCFMLKSLPHHWHINCLCPM